MSLTLYGHRGSGSAAMEAAQVLAHLPYRPVQAASWVPESAVDELRRNNPLAQIPALTFGDGSVMTESAAILIELGLRHPASGLLPADPAARAQALRGLVYLAANCYAMIGVIDFPDRVIDAPSMGSCNASTSAAGPACTACGMCLPTSSCQRAAVLISVVLPRARSTCWPRR